MTPDQALNVRKLGIDFVAMGKALMLQKDWAQKVKNGDLDKIRTKITSEEDRQLLDIPEYMKEYSKLFFKI